MCDLQVEAYQGCCNLLIEAYKGVVIWKLANVLRLKVLPSQRTEQQHSLLRLGLGLGLGFHSQPLKKQKNRRPVDYRNRTPDRMIAGLQLYPR